MKKKKEQIDFFYNFKIYLELLKKHRSLFFVILFVVFIIESSYTVDKFLFKAIIDNGADFTTKNITKENFIDTLVVVFFVFITTIVIKIISKWLFHHLLNRIDGNLILDLKKRFFDHIVQLSHNFHTTHKTGSLISRLTRGGRAIESVTDVLLFNFAPLVFQLIVVSLSLAYFDKVSAIIVFVIVVVYVIYSLIVQTYQYKYEIEANKEEDIEKANVSDFFTNIDSIKYFGKEIAIRKRFAQLIKNTKQAFLRSWDYYRWVDAGQSLILSVGIIFLIYFPLKSFLNGEITIGTLVFIYTIFNNLMGPLFGFIHGVKNLYSSMADFDALFQYGKIENEIKDKEDAKKLIIKNGSINFKDINFKYQKQSLFKKFDLEIQPNQKIALVGHSGSGKSTLIKLLYRLYDVDDGQILIDGKNIKDFTQESLRSEMSIVPQECVLFDDTIYNNIAFSRENATRKEVLNAIKFAQLDRVIAGFENKEKTIVGERGVKLSGGEKQRVSIARAILADKKVLLLDEATSSLDSQTEYEIQQDLEKLMKNRTSIIIAHRLSTIMKADTIVVLSDGKIVQSGKHNDLIKEGGKYQQLWNLQKGGYIK